MYSLARVDECYQFTGLLAHGSFGVVFKARNIKTKECVAIKKISIQCGKANGIQLIREMLALRIAEHRNIIQLDDVWATDDCVFLLMEYVGSSLRLAIDDVDRPKNDIVVRYYMHQLFSGVHYLHQIGIMHRDVKPDNVLITLTGVLKLSDFGQSCLSNRNEWTHLEQTVASRWYRAPELLFGSTCYTSKIDEWACGCIFVEFLNGAPLFSGQSDIEQIGKIVGLLGIPCEKNWCGWGSLPDSNKILFTNHRTVIDWRATVPSATGLQLSLLRRLITYSPKNRFSSAQALNHQFFTRVSRQTPYIPKPFPIKNRYFGSSALKHTKKIDHLFCDSSLL